MQTQPRPLANLKIDELAAEFVGARNYADLRRLQALDDELTRRKSRRARALSAHVSLALASAAKRAGIGGLAAVQPSEKPGTELLFATVSITGPSTFQGGRHGRAEIQDCPNTRSMGCGR